MSGKEYEYIESFDGSLIPTPTSSCLSRPLWLPENPDQVKSVESDLPVDSVTQTTETLPANPTSESVKQNPEVSKNLDSGNLPVPDPLLLVPGSTTPSSSPPRSSPPSPIPVPSPPPINNMAALLRAGRIGGILGQGEDVAIQFSGGGLHNKPRVPYTSNCYRATYLNVKLQQTVETACVKPLAEAHRLKQEPTKGGITFTNWMKEIQTHFMDHGLDSCFYILKRTPAVIGAGGALDITSVANTVECYLLDAWGQVSEAEIIAFDTAMRASACVIDKTNNRLARSYLRCSMSPDLKDLIDQDLDRDVSAAYMLWKIIQKVQGTNPCAARAVLKQIEKLRLSTEPAFDVLAFSTKVHHHCKVLAGLGAVHLPYDFSVLVHSCFDDTGIKMFDQEMCTLGNALDRNPQAYTWEQNLLQPKPSTAL